MQLGQLNESCQTVNPSTCLFLLLPLATNGDLTAGMLSLYTQIFISTLVMSTLSPKLVMCLNWNILRDMSVHSSIRRDRQGDFCCVYTSGIVHQAVSVLSCRQGVHAHICTQGTNFNVYT